MSFECEHRGELKRIELCQLCGSVDKEVEVFECKLHGECTVHAAGIRQRNKGKRLPLLPVCISCPDRTSKDEEPAEHKSLIEPNTAVFTPHLDENGEIFKAQTGNVVNSMLLSHVQKTRNGIKISLNRDTLMNRIQNRQSKIARKGITTITLPDSRYDCFDDCCGCCVRKVCFYTATSPGTVGLIQQSGLAAEKYKIIYSIGSDVINKKCSVVFLGRASFTDDSCGALTTSIPTRAEAPTYATYINNGGRIVISSEWYGAITGSGGCINQADIDNFNRFMGQIGSSITNDRTTRGGGCETGPTIGNFPILRGVPTLGWGDTTIINGGTTIFQSNIGSTNNDTGRPSTDQIPTIAIEQIGRGFVIAAADTNLFISGTCGNGNNATWVKNMVTLNSWM